MSDKYHRTLHVPWSPGATSDDKMLWSVDHLIGRELIISEKLDGENNCMTNEEGGYYARSHSGMPTHKSNNEGKVIHATRRHLIDPDISVFEEYCCAVHSIRYNLGLPAYAFVFGVRDDKTGWWWAWDDVVLMAAHLDLPTVPVLWRGTVRSSGELEVLTQRLCINQPSVYGSARPDGTFEVRPDKVTIGAREGVVIRLASEYKDPAVSIAKWVRAGHVATDEHWKSKPVERQPLAR
jgi:hypothetical protein